MAQWFLSHRGKAYISINFILVITSFSGYIIPVTRKISIETNAGTIINFRIYRNIPYLFMLVTKAVNFSCSVKKRFFFIKPVYLYFRIQHTTYSTESLLSSPVILVNENLAIFTSMGALGAVVLLLTAID